MIRLKINSITLFLLMLMVLGSCQKEEWNKRNQITDPSITQNLMEEIKANQNLSLFADYLVKTGYDKVLESSKSFTVWAPTNDALKAIDQSYITDTAQLRLLIGNYIANQSYFTVDANPSIRVKTLNGKNVIFTKTKLNDATILSTDQRAKNGVLHTLSQAFTPELNAWEYLTQVDSTSLQNKFLQTLQYGKVDPDSAELIGLDPKTGVPIYKPGTGIVLRNRFLQKVNINNEDSLVTYIVLTDAAYADEENKLIPYFADTTQAMTDSLAQWNLIKDFAINGLVSPDSLSATLYSDNDSVKMHIDPSAIVKTVKVSNGIVYVLNKLDYELDTKIKPVIIQGERFFDRMDPAVGYTIRTRRDPNTDSIFNDILVQNYGESSFWLRYPTTLNSVTYKVYWVAVNDFQTNTFPMMLAFKSHSDTAFANPINIAYDFKLPYTTVALNDYSQVYIGDFTSNIYGMEDLFIVGNNVKTNGNNTIVLDYIKLVPVLN
ncbi:fasciclin domain-containing protein [Arachidicoccus soli]|uniref:Fasciclin domain-containing protein n=1 Tax=Arachidicoccus soli TaxID=2341117 RepID=A0A386HRK8_9BACT|nr:fasciclin domain-containing protein [Arachidicoccus soli]AYD48289.1 fasciclin domain-containing protein [Arachidicoccus soli]